MSLPPVAKLCARLDRSEFVRYEDGSLPVYAVGEDLVLKLYPPEYRQESEIESRVLRAVEGKLPIPTPGVREVGELDGWGYVLMEQLPGRSLKAVWPELSIEDRARLAPQLGEALATLHAINDPALEMLDWGDFLVRQRAGVVDHQRRQGLDEAWLAQIPSFLDSVDLGSPRPVLLHTEFMREHLLMTRDEGGWAVSGLFDFEPAMRGAAEYEFVAVGLFVAGGDSDFLRRLLHGYGYSPDESFPRRCLAYALLHKYSNLRWYLDELPTPPEPTLPSLATAWWGC